MLKQPADKTRVDNEKIFGMLADVESVKMFNPYDHLLLRYFRADQLPFLEKIKLNISLE